MSFSLICLVPHIVKHAYWYCKLLLLILFHFSSLLRVKLVLQEPQEPKVLLVSRACLESVVLPACQASRVTE